MHDQVDHRIYERQMADECLKNRDFKKGLQYLTIIIDHEEGTAANYGARAFCRWQILLSSGSSTDFNEWEAIYADALVSVARQPIAQVFEIIGEYFKEHGALTLMVNAYNEAITSDLPVPRRYFARGQAFAQSQKWVRAIADLNFCFEQSYRLNEVIYLLAQCHYAIHQWQQASGWYSRHLLTRPNDAKALSQQAECHLHVGKLELAKADAQRAIKLDSNLPLPKAVLAECHALKNEWKPAWSFSQEALAINPQLGIAMVTQAKCYSYQGDKPKAISILNNTIQIDLRNEEAYDGLALLYHAAGSWAEAASALEKLNKLRPLTANRHTLAALCYAEMNDTAGVLRHAQKSIEQSEEMPNYAIALGLRARARQLTATKKEEMGAALNDYEHTARLYKNAKAPSNDIAAAYYKCAMAHHTAGYHGRAIDALNEAIRYAPHNPLYPYARALSQKCLDNLPASLADYNRALELDPKDPEKYSGRADCLMRMGKRDAAQKDLDEAFKLSPNLETTRVCQATLFYREEKYEQALAIANSVLATPTPKDVRRVALELRSVVREQLGDLAGAKADRNALQKLADK